MDKTITAELTHPEIQGPPLERGIRYGHHFVVELISDGRRLFAVASEEGRRIMNEISHGLTHVDRDAEPSVLIPNESGIGTELVTDQSNLPPQADGLDPDGKPATGGTPEPTHEAQGSGFDPGAAGHELQGRAESQVEQQQSATSFDGN